MNSRPTVLARANELFRNSEYEQALALYKQAKKVLGSDLVKLNVELCRRKILAESEAVAGSVDPVTSVLMHNSGVESLDNAALKAALEYYDLLNKHNSEALEIKPVNPIPADWPKDLKLAPLAEGTNDYDWYLKYRYKPTVDQSGEVGLSIIVPTFNRTRILDVTLACLVNQETSFLYEVIVADDGSQEDLAPLIRSYEGRLDIKYVRQRDYGYQLCAVRNLGLRAAKYDFVSILDCDMAPSRTWVDSYVKGLLRCDDIALIGPRKYVDTHEVSGEDALNNNQLIESLPEVRTNSEIGNRLSGEVSVDWRLEHFKKTENLRLCDSPFRFFSGGNVAFAKKWLSIAGWFDEEFTHWGGEDNEFGYRLFRQGCFFKAEWGGMAYHQEPPGRENETDRAAGKQITIKIVQEKVPYFYRKLEPIGESKIHRVPLVSIYVPAYNCEDTIKRCVDSALNQTVTDLEVCVCDDGSTDATRAILEKYYKNNPRVRYVTTENGGIGSASNSAVRLCRGFYIGQLDSDDYLEPDAVELCIKEFLKNRNLACVYTGNRNVDPDGSLISLGYNWPEYSREKLTSAMICHHFRMFTVRAWNLTGGFDESITNAVDYDMYLKLSEVGWFVHVNHICYNRVLHGENTSIKRLGEQKKNHFYAVNQSLARQGIKSWSYKEVGEEDSSRSYMWSPNSEVGRK